MKITYETRNGRTYAYTSTSKRVPGKANPVSVKEYLGVVDPDTGKIVPKSARSAPRTLPPDGARVLSYGDALIAKAVADRLGLMEDLEVVFGERARGILALALAQAIHPTSSDSIDVVLNSSYIPELIGLEGRMRNSEVRALVNSISQEEAQRFFVRRWSRTEGKLYAYAHSMVDSDGSSEAPGTVGPGSRTSILIVMSEEGEPVAFGLIGDPSTDTSLLEGALRFIGRGAECVFIADTALSPTLDLTGLIASGVDFAIPYDASSEQFRAVQSDYLDVESPEHRRDLGGDEYYLMEGRTGFMPSGGVRTFVPVSDPRLGECELVMRSFMCFDPRMRAAAKESLKAAVYDAKVRLNGRVFDDPEMVFVHTVGPLSGILRYRIGDGGAMKVTTSRKGVSAFNRDAGKTFVVVSSATWDDVVSGRVARSRTTKAIEQFNGGSRAVRKYVGRGVRTEQHLFVEFLAIMIYSDIQRVLAEADVRDVDVRTLMLIASSYRVVESDQRFIRGSRDRRLPRLFRALGIDDSDGPA